MGDGVSATRSEADFCIGPKIGTPGARGFLTSPDGVIQASSTINYLLLTGKPGWTGQGPETWWPASCQNDLYDFTCLCPAPKSSDIWHET